MQTKKTDVVARTTFYVYITHLFYKQIATVIQFLNKNVFISKSMAIQGDTWLTEAERVSTVDNIGLVNNFHHIICANQFYKKSMINMRTLLEDLLLNYRELAYTWLLDIDSILPRPLIIANMALAAL